MTSPLIAVTPAYGQVFVREAVQWLGSSIRRMRLRPEDKAKVMQSISVAFQGVMHDDYVRIMQQTKKQFPEDKDMQLIYRVHDVLSPEVAYKVLKEMENGGKKCA